MNGDKNPSPFKTHIKSKLISGLFIVLPVGITFIVLNIIYRLTAGIIDPFLEKLIQHFFASGKVPESLVVSTSIITFIILIYLIGLTASHFAGKRLITILESIVVQVPLLDVVYSGAKSIVNSFEFASKGKNSAFSEVVFIEFPRNGLTSIGFITGEISDTEGRSYYKVFVPTTPNPTSGFLIIVPSGEVVKTSLSVEDGIKMIVSGGIIGKNVFDKIFQDSTMTGNHTNLQSKSKGL